MADNVTLKNNVGSGTELVATKDIGGIQYPRIIQVTPAGADIAMGPSAPSAAFPMTLPNDVTVTGVASIAAVNTDLLTNTVNGWFDAANHHSCTIQILGAAGITGGAVIFEQTNDTAAAPGGGAGVAWPVLESSIVINNPVTVAQTIAASTIRIFEGAILARFVRVRVSTAFMGANVQAVGVFSQLPYMATRLNVMQTSAVAMNATVSQGTAANLQTTITPTTPTATAINSAATTNATSVKASAGTLYTVTISNINAAARFLKLYNKASAPTVGTDVPILTIPVAANAIANINFGELGYRFATGIALAITGAAADTDTTVVGANENKVVLSYL